MLQIIKYTKSTQKHTNIAFQSQAYNISWLIIKFSTNFGTNQFLITQLPSVTIISKCRSQYLLIFLLLFMAVSMENQSLSTFKKYHKKEWIIPKSYKDHFERAELSDWQLQYFLLYIQMIPISIWHLFSFLGVTVFCC